MGADSYVSLSYREKLFNPSWIGLNNKKGKVTFINKREAFLYPHISSLARYSSSPFVKITVDVVYFWSKMFLRKKQNYTERKSLRFPMFNLSFGNSEWQILLRNKVYKILKITQYGYLQLFQEKLLRRLLLDRYV